jgi:hypothetical protein
VERGLVGKANFHAGKIGIGEHLDEFHGLPPRLIEAEKASAAAAASSGAFAILGQTGTSMIGNSQGKTEISLHSGNWSLQARS